ncbi:MAG TPA: hypothetical protein VFY93_01785 [Planctomycetota bacterium]|nr:hypothetical protein [Planctomycetota bacterium]
MRRFLGLALLAAVAMGDVGDPQVRTDHPWYPGELAFSTFERLFATEAEIYERVTGEKVETDERKALASWLFRSTHYFHCAEAGEHQWDEGAAPPQDLERREWPREYWTGLFARGFGLCYTTHAEWAGEMEYLLGHGRARANEHGIHTSFEVFLKGGAYGEGRWALLDHDISSALFDAEGTRLISLAEARADPRLEQRDFCPERQRGWLPHGLHEDDTGAYATWSFSEALPGYAGPPPMVHLRRGETLRRYPEPGLGDGRTFVFWGRNMGVGRVPGPERDRTWVNRPDEMRGSRAGATPKPGLARYGNAAFSYRPDFASADYREGVADEGPDHVVFSFSSPYLIAATPAGDGPWGVTEPGCTNGLVLRGKAACPVALSVDRGRTWQECGAFRDGLDLTDRVKGRRQYLLRLGAGAKDLAGKGLVLTTVCQASCAVVPRLKDDGAEVTFYSTGQAVVSAGPCLDQAGVVDGAFNTPSVTLEVATPHGEPAVAVYAAAQVESGNPPDPEARYAIDCSIDGGKTWQPVVKDWTVPRLGEEPPAFWPWSLCFGSRELEGGGGTVHVRFSNTAGRKIARAEAHLVCRTPSKDATKVTFDWADKKGGHRASQVFAPGVPATWKLDTGANTTTWWVEFEPVTVR